MSKEQSATRGETPPNRSANLGWYIKWYMDEKAHRHDPSKMGLVLDMAEWQRIVDALSAPSEIVQGRYECTVQSPASPVSARRPRDGEACPTCGLAQGIQTGASHG